MELKNAISSEINKCQGIDNAISAVKLIEILKTKYEFETSDRELRDIISLLILEENEFIGSCTDGYYIITNEHDYKVAYHYLVDPIALMAKRAEKLKFLWRVKYIGVLL